MGKLNDHTYQPNGLSGALFTYLAAGVVLLSFWGASVVAESGVMAVRGQSPEAFKHSAIGVVPTATPTPGPDDEPPHPPPGIDGEGGDQPPGDGGSGGDSGTGGDGGSSGGDGTGGDGGNTSGSDGNSGGGGSSGGDTPGAGDSGGDSGGGTSGGDGGSGGNQDPNSGDDCQGDCPVCYVTKIEGGFEFAAPVFEYGAVPVSFEFDYLNFEIKWSVRDSNNVLVYAGFISGAELAAASSVAPESVPSSGALLTASLSPAPEWYDGNGWCGYTETAAGTEYVCDAPFLYHFTGRFSLSFTSASGLPGLALPNFDRGYTLSVEPSGGPTPIQFFWSSYGHFVQDQNSAGYDVFSAYGGGDLTTAQNQFRDIQNFRPPLQWGAPGYGQSSFECPIFVPECALSFAFYVYAPRYQWNHLYRWYEGPVEPDAKFLWQFVDLDTGQVVFEGIALGSDFQPNGYAWVYGNADGSNNSLTFEGRLEYRVEQIAGTHHCGIGLNATINHLISPSEQTSMPAGGFRVDCHRPGDPDVCYPQFDCQGELRICPQG